jgi:glutathione S-transferase
VSVLFHFINSPFSRRVRLAFAHKGVEVELCEARENPQRHADLKARSPFVTVPVLVEDDGRVLGESASIVAYLDHAYPDRPRLWPGSADAFVACEVQSLVDAALDSLTAAGNRFFKVSGDPAWKDVRAFETDRIERAFAVLAARVGSLGRPTIAASGWSAADIWLYTMVHWLEIMPARSANHAISRQILSLGWTLPPALVDWAHQHDDRPDVRALGGL